MPPSCLSLKQNRYKRNRIEQSNRHMNDMKSDSTINNDMDSFDILTLFGRDEDESEKEHLYSNNEKKSCSETDQYDEEMYSSGKKPPEGNRNVSSFLISDQYDEEMSPSVNKNIEENKNFPSIPGSYKEKGTDQGVHVYQKPKNSDYLSNQDAAEIEISFSCDSDRLISDTDLEIFDSQSTEAKSDSAFPQILTVDPKPDEESGPNLAFLPESTTNLNECQKSDSLQFIGHVVIVQIIKIENDGEIATILLKDLSHKNTYNAFYTGITPTRTLNSMNLEENEIIGLKDFAVWRICDFMINVVSENIIKMN